jgi:hypothetical protein
VLAALFGILPNHLLWRADSPGAGHSPAWLRRLGTRDHARHLLGAQRLEEGPTQPDHHEHERRRREDGCRLQAIEAAGKEEDRRRSTRERPQITTIHPWGFMLPLVESMPITTEAASAPLTKKKATRIIAISDIKPASGNWLRVANSAFSSPSFTAPEMSPTPLSSRFMAVPPSTANHTKLTTLGIRSTPTTNSRILRPREMRAMKVPTNGAQEIHHAQ